MSAKQLESTPRPSVTEPRALSIRTAKARGLVEPSLNRCDHDFWARVYEAELGLVLFLLLTI